MTEADREIEEYQHRERLELEELRRQFDHCTKDPGFVEAVATEQREKADFFRWVTERQAEEDREFEKLFGSRG